MQNRLDISTGKTKLTYLQENFKPVAHRPTGRLVSKSSMRRMRKLCTLRPHIGDAKELEVVNAMDAEDHGEAVHEMNFFLSAILMVSESHLRLFSYSPRV